MTKAIYKITNIVNGKSYIGQSVNPIKRFASHCSRAKMQKDHSIIHAAIKKYGRENFKLDILEWTENYNQREKELIQEYNTLSPYGYNIALGGNEPPHKYGENHHKCIITNEEVNMVICLLKYSELTEPEIGKWFKKSFNQTLIHNINYGITHRRNNESYPIRTDCPYNLNSNQVAEIKWLLKNTEYPCSQIAEYYNVNTSTIKHINSGKNHNDKAENYPLRKKRGKKQSQPVEAILAKRSTEAIDTLLEMGVCTSCV